ncbi:hypothetical protein FHS89_002875 [Rubricella aquisinus]|uniref:Holin-X, holin superfamily III n=1 Tax=Rubricella aquisinus TaxID=2028108 RepID=A0A840WS33_9RHOB|nr:phage holin family protein [Rubricella aquisinus]MBB5516833.1 hypothetical protein [Rubricella aquisinus]
MFDQIEQKASRAAKSAALGTGGALCLAVGAGFLTVAAWIYLATLEGTLFAAGIIGAVYVGIGLILIGLASARRSDVPHAHPAPQTSAQTPPLAEAFLFGLQAGRGVQKGQRS